MTDIKRARVSRYELHNGTIFETCEDPVYSIPVAFKSPRGWRVLEGRELDPERDAFLANAMKECGWE